MEIKKFFREDNDSRDLLYKFAYCGRREQTQAYIKELADLAEKENWTSESSDYDFDILMSYFLYTFEKAATDDLVMINEDDTYACFNTGLMSENGEDIICIFNEFTSSTKFHWHLFGFRKESDWDFLNQFSETPHVVSYFNDPSKIYFNPKLSVVKNLDHILNDNISRFPKVLQDKGVEFISSLLGQSFDLTLKRCERNYRIAVPQYYNKQITYLLPVELDGHYMACAVEYVNGRYRVNTIFTLEMAYKNARLLMKPESDWLSIETKKRV